VYGPFCSRRRTSRDDRGGSAKNRFKATIDKLRELGLPAAFPWTRVNAPE